MFAALRELPIVDQRPGAGRVRGDGDLGGFVGIVSGGRRIEIGRRKYRDR